MMYGGISVVDDWMNLTEKKMRREKRKEKTEEDRQSLVYESNVTLIN